MNNKDLKDFLKKRKELFRDYDINEIWESIIVEKICKYGELEEIIQLKNILWKEKIKNFLKEQFQKERVDYPPRLIKFLSVSFDLENELPLWRIIQKAKKNTEFYKKF